MLLEEQKVPCHTWPSTLDSWVRLVTPYNKLQKLTWLQCIILETKTSTNSNFKRTQSMCKTFTIRSMTKEWALKWCHSSWVHIPFHSSENDKITLRILTCWTRTLIRASKDNTVSENPIKNDRARSVDISLSTVKGRNNH